MTLHVNGSGNPLGVSSNSDRIPMHPYYMFKDLITIFLFFLAMAIIVFYLPNVMGQLWPVTYYIFIYYVWKYAVCWNSSDLKYLSYKNYCKTVLISYYHKFKITFIENFIKVLNTGSVKYCISGLNQQVTKVNYWRVGTSETLRVQKSKFSSMVSNKLNEDKDKKFNQWLRGLIDGDGCFMISKQGGVSCEITVRLEDEKMLRVIQDKIGGIISPRSGAKAVRIRIRQKKQMIDLVNRVNGYIYNSVRFNQLNRLCAHLNIPCIIPDQNNVPLPWFIGILDADGTINFYPHFKNEILYRNQLTIRVYQKYLINIQAFQKMFGGSIYYDKRGSGGYQWKINSKREHLRFYEKFIEYPCKSVKANRVFLVKEYYNLTDLKAFKADKRSRLAKAWNMFIKKWNNKLL